MTAFGLQLFTGFDIETKPNPAAVDRFLKPFPDFDESAVKCGNLKDPVKIAEKKAEAKAQHEADRLAHIKKAHDEASLNPFTATVLVIGLINEDGDVVFLEGEEKTILTLFWMHFTTYGDAARKFVYWSGCGASDKNFDLDFIVTRSRITGVRVPGTARSGRYYAHRFVDLASDFLLHQREQYLSLTKAADLMGLYELWSEGDMPPTRIWPKSKEDPVTGENFWKWYEGTAEQRAKALEYLTNDLRHLLHLAPRIL